MNRQVFNNLNFEPMKTFNYIITSFITILSTIFLQAQEISSTVTPEIHVCGTSEEFTIEIKNTSNTAYSNVITQIDLPDGIKYITGSLIEPTYGTTESSSSNQINFSTQNIPANQTLLLSYSLTAKTNAITFQNNGGIFRNQINVTHNNGSQDHLTNHYNILYAALTITNVNDLDETAHNGEIFTREVTIKNGGYGYLTTFDLEDDFDENNLELLSVNMGAINDSKITLSGTDISNFGDGDNLFERNEELTIIQTLKVKGCSSTESKLTAIWGCDNKTRLSNSLYPYTTIKNSLSASIQSNTESAYNGQIINRQITITHNGYDDLSQISIFNDQDLSILELTSVNIGSISNSRTVVLQGNDFNSIGDGDNLFEHGESITITESIKVIGCNSTSSVINILWECNNVPQEILAGNINTTVQLNEPELVVSTTPSFNTCVEEIADNQKLIITNIGDGISFSSNLTIKLPYTGIFSTIDASTIKYKTSTSNNYQSISPNNSTNSLSSGDWSCLNTISNAKNSITLGLPDIQPGESIEIVWDQFTCNTNHCSSTKLTGWNYDLSYKNNCGSGQEYNLTNQTGLPTLTNTSAFNCFIEGPSDLNHNEIGNYELTFNNASFYPNITTNSSYYEVHFVIDNGFRWSGNNDDLTFNNKTTSITPNYVDVDYLSQIIIARFNNPIPFSFDESFFSLNLTLDTNYIESSLTDPTLNLAMQLFYVPDGSCSNPYLMPLSCVKTTKTVGHNQDYSQCEGLIFNKATTNRISLGSPDNNQDGIADASGALNMQKIKTRRVMQGDTLSTTYYGKVQSFQGQSWVYGYANHIIPNPYGDDITFIEASLTFNDASTGNTYTTNNISASSNINSQALKTSANFSIPTLVANGESQLAGISFENNDLIEITFKHKVTQNIGATIQNITTPTEFYISQQQNPSNASDKFSCDNYKTYFSLLGYDFTSDKKTTKTVNSCNTTLNQYYYFKIGGSEHAGSDMFPYEYRNWGFLDSTRIQLPAGYEATNINIHQYRTQYLNSSKKETHSNVSFTQVNLPYTSNLVTANFKEAFKNNGGNINLSDDGFNGYVEITLNPQCEIVPENQYQDITWTYLLKTSAFLNNEYKTHTFNQNDRVRYQRGNLQTTTSQQTKTGNGPLVTWDIQVKNNGNGSAENGFLHAISPTGDLTIIDVKDDNGNSVNVVNGIYQLGAFSTGQNKNYKITASYYTCHPDNIIVYTGYDCDGYPNNYDDYKCFENHILLNIIPNPSELQSRIRGYGEQDCSTTANVEIEFSSVKLAHVKDIIIDLTSLTATGVSIVPGSSKLLYPEEGVFLAVTDPTQDGSIFTFTQENMGLPSTLPGITNTDSNTAFLQFTVNLGTDFKAGDFVQANISANRVCGEALPEISLIFDPYAIYKQPDVFDVDEIGNNWGMAWGDYNNDGFSDLFVTNYDKTQPNVLYKNNGNKSFSKVSSGEIVTDLASSLAASWGDYNNDGNLDLYVANNIGSNNYLYKNNGDETFTKVTNDPIVNYNSYAHSCSWVDINNDGYLDMYVADYFPTKNNALYINNRIGGFTRNTNSIIVESTSHSVTAAWSDYDNDGNIDLFIANTDGENNSLYRNIGNGDFEAVTTGDIVNDAMNSVGASWGDYNNDGNMDLFVTNASRTQPNLLYKNNGDGSFTKVTTGKIVTDIASSHGSNWTDINGDGYLDLLVTNDNNENNLLYINNGNETFTSIKNAITQSGGNSFGVGTADYDNDGDLDIFIANHKDATSGNLEDNFFYENQRGGCLAKTCITLQGTNTSFNALGAKIEVNATIYGESVSQFRQLTAQSGGLGSQNDATQIFGLGDATSINYIKILWPSGMKQTLNNITVDSCLTIIEPTGAVLETRAYHDANNNCIKEESENFLNKMEIKITDSQLSRTVFTNNRGFYTSNVPADTYTAESKDQGIWTSSCPSTVTVNIGDTGIQKVPFFTNCTSQDLKIDMSTTVVRPGFDVTYFITIVNNGSANSETSTTEITVPNDFTVLDANFEWINNVNNVVTFEIPVLKQNEEIQIELQLNANREMIIGNETTLSANILTTSNDCDFDNNSIQYAQTIVGSIDPNEIHVNPIGETNKHFIKSTQQLTYKILFQNKGTYEATNVIITDSLDAGLDISTIASFKSSHNGSVKYTNDGVITWTFLNIGLPFEEEDEEGSNGYVEFSISPKANQENEAVIENNADIYFDFNDPIRTNTVFNTISDEYFLNKKNAQLIVFPNPNKTFFTLELWTKEIIYNTQILNTMGKIVYNKNESKSLIEINHNWEPGAYLVKVIGEDGKSYSKTIIIN